MIVYMHTQADTYFLFLLSSDNAIRYHSCEHLEDEFAALHT